MSVKQGIPKGHVSVSMNTELLLVGTHDVQRKIGKYTVKDTKYVVFCF